MFDNFGDRLFILRRIRGLTTADVANVVYVSPSLISKWESKRSAPHYTIMVAISHAFNCSLGWLVGDEPLDTIEGAEK